MNVFVRLALEDRSSSRSKGHRGRHEMDKFSSRPCERDSQGILDLPSADNSL